MINGAVIHIYLCSIAHTIIHCWISWCRNSCNWTISVWASFGFIFNFFGNLSLKSLGENYGLNLCKFKVSNLYWTQIVWVISYTYCDADRMFTFQVFEAFLRLIRYKVKAKRFSDFRININAWGFYRIISFFILALFQRLKLCLVFH